MFFQTCEHMSVYYQEYGHVPACFGVCILSNTHKHVYMFWIRVCSIVYFWVCMHMYTHAHMFQSMCAYFHVFWGMHNHVCICLHMCACIHMFSGVSICLQVCECVYLSLYVFGSHLFHVCTYVRVFSGVSVYSYVYLCPCVFRCVCIFICVSVSMCFQVCPHAFRSVTCCSYLVLQWPWPQPTLVLLFLFSLISQWKDRAPGAPRPDGVISQIGLREHQGLMVWSHSQYSWAPRPAAGV